MVDITLGLNQISVNEVKALDAVAVSCNSALPLYWAKDHCPTFLGYRYNFTLGDVYIVGEEYIAYFTKNSPDAILFALRYG